MRAAIRFALIGCLALAAASMLAAVASAAGDPAGFILRNRMTIPTTLLIDAEDREVGRKLGALEWDSAAVVGALWKSFQLTDQTPARLATPNEGKLP